ncbi:unnamed protein product [Owenia fusiformis]|uniref:Uncharacterized protein n=1 Tax=Owenia fusiformis TaxID=6347 RepID=A0A8S4N1L7_OWEFU|nr:unnamed protein product [Owenia fusiformis]
MIAGQGLLWLCCIATVSSASGLYNPSNTGAVCGGLMKAPHGNISTPNFPNNFPVPLKCTWLIYAPPGKKIALYFTQYYLKESFQISEYTYYQDENLFMGRSYIRNFLFEDEITFIIGSKPYMLIQLDVADLTNLHIRVEDFLTDVYGFNITYEIVPENSQPRYDACSVYSCSFLGNCLASEGFESYKCHCFPGFWGQECEYGPHCDPIKGNNSCYNGGSCRYFFGSRVNFCDCPPGFEGNQCENRVKGYLPPECVSLACDQLCLPRDVEVGGYTCSCKSGFKLDVDNRTCVQIDNLQSMIKLYVLNTTKVTDQWFGSVKQKLWQFFYLQNGNHKITLQINDGTAYLELYFPGHIKDENDVIQILKDPDTHASLLAMGLQSENFSLHYEPAFSFVGLSNQDPNPVIQGNILTLMCESRGSKDLTFTWYKDGSRVDVHRASRDMYITRMPMTEGGLHASVLSIHSATPYEEGDFTCQVEDWLDRENKTLHVYVITPPDVSINPSHKIVPIGSRLSITCLSRDDNFGKFKYHWLRNNKPVNKDMVEELLPTGSRLHIQYIRMSVVYTCVVRNEAGISSEESRIDVLNHTSLTTELGQNICQSEAYKDVKWDPSYSNSSSVRSCPAGSKGKATRACVCGGTGCYWEEPIFTTCISNRVNDISCLFENLKNGYMVTREYSILQQMNMFLSRQLYWGYNIYAGDLIKLTELLQDVYSYSDKFMDDHMMQQIFKETLEVTSQILTKSRVLTNYEKKGSFHLGVQVLEVVEVVMASFIEKQQNILNKMPSDQLSIKVDNLEVNFTKVARTDVRYKRHEDEILNESPLSVIGDTDVYDEMYFSAVVKYKNIWQIMANESIGENTVNSKIYSLYIPSSLGEEYSPSLVRLEHLDKSQEKKLRIRCAQWKSRLFPNGYWDLDGCNVVGWSINYTTCRCNNSGHISLLLVSTSSDNVELEVNHVTPLIVTVGYITSLVSFCITFFIYTIFRRHYKHNRPISVIFMCIVMIILSSLLLAGMDRYNMKMVCKSVYILLYCFYIMTLSIQLTTSTDLYLNLLDKIQSKFNILWKAGLILGVPFIFSLPVVIASILDDMPYSQRHFCWVSVQSWQFYLFSIAMLLMLVIWQVFNILVLNNIHKLDYVKNREKLEIIRWILKKSLVTAVFLFLSCVCIILRVNVDHTGIDYLTGISNIVLGVWYFLSECIMRKWVGSIVHRLKCSTESAKEPISQCSSLHVQFKKKKNVEKQSPKDEGFVAFVRPHKSSMSSNAEDIDTRDLKRVKERKSKPRARLDSSRALLESTVCSDDQDYSRRQSVASYITGVAEEDKIYSRVNYVSTKLKCSPGISYITDDTIKEFLDDEEKS